MTEIEVFQFPGNGREIRMVMRGDEPWFVLADVCRALDLSNPTTVASRLEPGDLSTAEVIDSVGRKQEANVVNEAGLYDVVFMSRKKSAKDFKRWISHDVLPAIRRTGRYELAPQPAALLPDMTTPEGRLAVAEMLADGARREISLGIERDQARAELVAVQPKVDYVTGFVDAEEDASILRVFAIQVGTTDPKLREYLKQRKVLSRRTVDRRWSNSKQRLEPVYEWLPYASYLTWFAPKDQPDAPRLHNGQMRTTLYVTPVGKVGIRRLLMKWPLDGEAA
jgi:prophage antirepressor-like protein